MPRELAEREGLAGLAPALAELIDKAGRPGPQRGCTVSRLARLPRLVVLAPLHLYRRVISPGLPRRCKYEPTCSRYAAQAPSGSSAYCAGSCWRAGVSCAATRGATAATTRWARSASSRRGPRCPTDRARNRHAISANVLQPLIDVFESVLTFFHDTVGTGWGMSIICLTIVVRAALIPLTLKQFRSMQCLARLAPEIKALQAKYKDDRQSLNQEMMKFYQENKVNPFGSCLPLLLQLPVFLSLFYMLRKDLKLDICGDALQASRRTATDKVIEKTPCDQVAGDSGQFLFIPDLTDKATGGC